MASADDVELDSGLLLSAVVGSDAGACTWGVGVGVAVALSAGTEESDAGACTAGVEA